MKVGFTGTQTGMTAAQTAAFAILFGRLGAIEFHHGDCIGADDQADYIVSTRYSQVALIIHPPINESKRAFCLKRNNWSLSSKELPAKDYIARNHDIVDAATVLIATPKEDSNQLRSGTWATVRYAKKQGKRVLIILPTGAVI